MKKLLCLFASLTMLVALFGCGKGSSVRNNIVNTYNMTSESEQNDAPDEEKESVSRSGASEGEYDVDLTKLNNTMVYSEVSHMMYAPEEYLGKKVKMSGTFNKMEANGRYYYSCLISDATACCSNGIEFILAESGDDPDAYPKQGKEITVAGYFDTYEEDNYTYCQLIDAVML